jgi:ADP-ribose pyrophosphatase YjhB (NUDIX family)
MNEPTYNEEDLLDHHAIGAVIFDDKKRILMQEHLKYGFWTIPIGKIKKNQEVLEGLKEEIFEECNLSINACKEILVDGKDYLRNGKKIKVLNHIFLITNHSGELKNKEPEKHSQQKFIDLETIKNFRYLSDATVMYLGSLGYRREALVT